MPLHDWSELSGWEGVRVIWIVELLRWIKPRLPPNYRAYVGSSPALAIGAGAERPDVAVREWRPEPLQSVPLQDWLRQPKSRPPMRKWRPSRWIRRRRCMFPHTDA